MGQNSLSYKMLYSDMHKHFIELGDHLVLYYNRGEPMNEGRRQEPDPGGDSLIYGKPRGILISCHITQTGGSRSEEKKITGDSFFCIKQKISRLHTL